MIRPLVFVACAWILSTACCMACRPIPKPGPVELATLLADPDPYVGHRIQVRLRIDHYDPATRTASRTLAGGKSPLYRCEVAAGEDDPVPGVHDLRGTVSDYVRSDTGLGDRPYCLTLKDCRMVRVGD